MVVVVTNQRKNTSWCTKGQTSEGMSFPGTDFGPLERRVILMMMMMMMMMMRKIIMNMRVDQPYIGSANVHEALSLMTMTDDIHTRTEMITCLTCLSSTAKGFRVALRKHCPETAETQTSLFIVTDSNT